jgi:hypothetical protein
MSTMMDPNPSTRKNEAFPKTTTLPEGWNGDALMTSASASPSARKDAVSEENVRPTPTVDEELFSRRLDPFPKPNTIPNGWDLSEMNS